jgi:hypothetical protein
MAHFFKFYLHYWIFVKRDKLLSKKNIFKYENITFKKNVQRKLSDIQLYDKTIKMPSKFHETISLNEELHILNGLASGYYTAFVAVQDNGFESSDIRFDQNPANFTPAILFHRFAF